MFIGQIPIWDNEFVSVKKCWSCQIICIPWLKSSAESRRFLQRCDCLQYIRVGVYFSLYSSLWTLGKTPTKSMGGVYLSDRQDYCNRLWNRFEVNPIQKVNMMRLRLRPISYSIYAAKCKHLYIFIRELWKMMHRFRNTARNECITPASYFDKFS
jgi:hypothetical protein